MFVDANIVTTSTSEMALPENAIMEQEGSYFVLLLKHETDSYEFQTIQVEIGNTSNGYTSIKPNSKFTKESKFLTQGGFNLVGEESGGHSH